METEAKPVERIPLKKKLRFDVFKRDGFTCQYCGRKPPTVVLQVDHIHPVAAGGKNMMDNLLTACFECNNGKSAGLLTSVPASLESRAAEKAERQEQIKAYERLLKAVKRHEDKSIEFIESIFNSSFPGFVFTESFRESTRVFVQELPIDEVEKAMRMACWRLREDKNRATKYFCGICWRRMRGEGAQL